MLTVTFVLYLFQTIKSDSHTTVIVTVMGTIKCYVTIMSASFNNIKYKYFIIQSPSHMDN